MQKFLKDYFFKGQEWWVGVITVEIIFQAITSIYLLVNGLGGLQRNSWQSTIFMHNFLHEHWWAIVLPIILFIVGDICLFFAMDKFRDYYYEHNDKSYFESIFYLGCNILFGGHIIFAPITIILVIIMNSARFFAFLCECAIAFHNKLSVSNMLNSYRKKSPEKYKKTIIDEYNKLVGTEPW